MQLNNNTPLSLLQPMAEQLNEKLQQIAAETHIDWAPELDRQLKLVQSRASEVKSKAFVIIVVGPVKSGKSTFVNLLAHEKVSPMDYLECTVRPSVISQREEGQPSVITTFKLEEPQEQAVLSSESLEPTSAAKYVEAIIDYLKGLEGSSLKGVKMENYPLTAENLKRQVEMPANFERLDPSIRNKNLMTSITAKGGDFLSENIYLVDMPGFDGLVANLSKNEDYATITRRADLVVFIQSTNSAIGKIQDDFFKVLHDGNSKVPVCLIHNVYESGYWRTPEEQQEAIRKHEESAMEIIRGAGFNLPAENCFCINLGMVSDAQPEEGAKVQEKYRDQLDKANAQFRVIEQKLHDQIITSQSTTRLLNCINRTQEERERLISMLDQRLALMREERDRFENLQKKLEEGAIDTCHVYDAVKLGMKIDWDPMLRQMAELPERFSRKQLNASDSYPTETARQIILDLEKTIERQVVQYVKTHFDIEAKKNVLNLMSEQRQLQINTLFLKALNWEVSPLKLSVNETMPEIDTEEIEGYFPVEEKIRKKTFFWQEHSSSEVYNYMLNAVSTIVGVDSRIQDVTPDGVLALDFLPKVELLLETEIREFIERRARAFAAYYHNLCEEALAKVKPAATSYNTQIEQLETLMSKLKKLE